MKLEAQTTAKITEILTRPFIRFENIDIEKTVEAIGLFSADQLVELAIISCEDSIAFWEESLRTGGGTDNPSKEAYIIMEQKRLKLLQALKRELDTFPKRTEQLVAEISDQYRIRWEREH